MILLKQVRWVKHIQNVNHEEQAIIANGVKDVTVKIDIWCHLSGITCHVSVGMCCM